MSTARAQITGFVFLLLAAPLSAAGHEQIDKRGSTVATLQIDKTTLPLSGRLQVTLTIEGLVPLEVELPGSVASPKELWLEQAAGPPETAALPNQRQRWRQRFRLEPLGTKEMPLQIAPLRFRAARADVWQELAWKPVTIQVTTTVEEPSVKAMRDITPIEPVPPTESPPYALVAGAVAAVVLLLLLLRITLRRRPRPIPELSASEWAARELDCIDALDLPTEHEVERFHVLVSDVLRQYVERRFGLPATGQTTTEFLERVRGSTLLAAHQQEALREFLRQCDLAKFARAEFSPFECKALARIARDFIRQTTPAPDQSELAARD
jgi:hypothetical protein